MQHIMSGAKTYTIAQRYEGFWLVEVTTDWRAGQDPTIWVTGHFGPFDSDAAAHKKAIALGASAKEIKRLMQTGAADEGKAVIEYRGYEIAFRKGDRLADVRKVGSAMTAKVLSRDRSNDRAWLVVEAKAFIDADLSNSDVRV